jgi:hypothetical protein
MGRKRSKKKWESEKRDVFGNNIDQTKVNELLSELTNFQVDNVNSLTVHNLVDKTCQILLNSAVNFWNFYT